MALPTWQPNKKATAQASHWPAEMLERPTSPCLVLFTVCWPHSLLWAPLLYWPARYGPNVGP